MKITLKDGKILEFAQGATVYDIAKEISPGLARVALCARVNDELVDLSKFVSDDSKIEILTFKDEEGKKAYRHSTAHVLAQAVKNIYPTSKLAIGPAIDNGFYYDIDFKSPITFDDIFNIENEMKKIIKADYKFIREDLNMQEAQMLMTQHKEIYKLDILSELPEDSTISFYRQGSFVDMCTGPHIYSTGQIKAFKLTQLAGAYWRGSEKNKMLSRIYGTCFDNKKDLKEYLEKLEEAKKRDHNKLGRDLGLFMTDENIGQGLPLLMPKGAKLMQILQRFVEDVEEERGYQFTKTPFMAKNNLYKLSGHWDHYKDGMFVIEEEGETLALRPMTCPFQYTIYNNGLKSYKDLPVRYAETSTLFRNEGSGEMHGLIRVRQFTLSDGHIICTKDQLEEEFMKAFELTEYMLKSIGLIEDITYRFSRWDPDNREKYIDDEIGWEETENIMFNIFKKFNIEYTDAKGEAAFYGPKLDIQIKNVYGKEDTIITIQIDMFLSERFNMTYIDENGEKRNPYIIHRSSIGCYERSIALILEKFKGNLPLWMAPVQVKVMSLTDRTNKQAQSILDRLQKRGIRCSLDTRSETIGYKIRQAQMEKIPYMLIIGDRDVKARVVSIRSREGEQATMKYSDFVKKIEKEIKDKVMPNSK